MEWIDTYVPQRELPALKPEEITLLIERATSTMVRALVQVLFDGGFRIGELQNVRLRHVRLAQIDLNKPVKRCFVIRVPFSKTIRRTVALPMPETTKWLTRWLDEHPGSPRVHSDGSLDAPDSAVQLFPVSLATIQRHLRELGKRTLGKSIHPHLLRHSSATYWSGRLSYFQQCKRFGWTMTSKMPQRYIDQQGLDDLEVARAYVERSERAPSEFGSAIGV